MWVVLEGDLWYNGGMDYEKVESLLKEVKPIVERDEVHTRSAFLAELLNPKGSHGMKDKFLKLFIECMPLNAIETHEVNVWQ